MTLFFLALYIYSFIYLFNIFFYFLEGVIFIIVKNIRYLLWNRNACSLNKNYRTFLAPFIRCTDHSCDSCALSDKSQHLYRHYSRWFKMLTYCDVIDTWADRWKLWRHNDRLFLWVSMNALLSQRRWGHWFKEFVKYTHVPSFSCFIIVK